MPDNPWFPALGSGVCCQLPVSLSIDFLGTRNEFQDLAFLSDSASQRMKYQWSLELQSMTDSEAATLDAFIAAREQDGGAFQFVDPLGNLLLDSENLNAASWSKAPALEMVTFDDPLLGASWLFTNSSGTPLEISQVLTLPGSYATCLSAWMKVVGGGDSSLQLESGADIASAATVGSGWRRIHQVLRPQSGSTSRQVKFSIGPNSQCLIAKPMVEVGWKPSGYAPTAGRNAVFENCRFQQQSFVWSQTAPGAHSISLVVESIR